MSLREFIGKVQKEIERKESIRQEVQLAARSATRLSKMAIFMTHQGRYGEAERMLKEADTVFSNIKKICRDDPDLYHSGIVDAAYQEYAEAHIFLKLIKEDKFVGFEEINVKASSYILGLIDVIGELRRKVLDSIREGKTSAAEKYLELMDTIYNELNGMGDAYFILSGLRRKCDVARRIIESTRGDVTIEIRRRSLEDSMEKLIRILEKELHSHR